MFGKKWFSARATLAADSFAFSLPPTLSCGGARGHYNTCVSVRDRHPARFSAPQGGLVHLDSSPGIVHTYLLRTADLGKSKQRLCCWLCCLRPHKLRGPRWDEQMAVTSRAQKAEGSCPPQMDYSSLDVLITSSAGQGRSLTRTNATTGLAEEFATKSTSHGSSWLWKEADQRRITAERNTLTRSVGNKERRLKYPTVSSSIQELSTCDWIHSVHLSPKVS